MDTFACKENTLKDALDNNPGPGGINFLNLVKECSKDMRAVKSEPETFRDMFDLLTRVDQQEEKGKGADLVGLKKDSDGSPTFQLKFNDATNDPMDLT